MSCKQRSYETRLTDIIPNLLLPIVNTPKKQHKSTCAKAAIKMLVKKIDPPISFLPLSLEPHSFTVQINIEAFSFSDDFPSLSLSLTFYSFTLAISVSFCLSSRKTRKKLLDFSFLHHIHNKSVILEEKTGHIEAL